MTETVLVSSASQTAQLRGGIEFTRECLVHLFFKPQMQVAQSKPDATPVSCSSEALRDERIDLGSPKGVSAVSYPPPGCSE
jgi:hypothetical protein